MNPMQQTTGLSQLGDLDTPPLDSEVYNLRMEI
jgi:hypothetical protein